MAIIKSKSMATIYKLLLLYFILGFANGKYILLKNNLSYYETHNVEKPLESSQRIKRYIPPEGQTPVNPYLRSMSEVNEDFVQGSMSGKIDHQLLLPQFPVQDETPQNSKSADELLEYSSADRVFYEEEQDALKEKDILDVNANNSDLGETKVLRKRDLTSDLQLLSALANLNNGSYNYTNKNPQNVIGNVGADIGDWEDYMVNGMASNLGSGYSQLSNLLGWGTASGTQTTTTSPNLINRVGNFFTGIPKTVAGFLQNIGAFFGITG